MDKLRGIILDKLTFLRRCDDRIGIIIPASPFDTYCIGTRWFSANSFYVWSHNTPVDAIHFCQSYHFQMGQPFEIHSPLEKYSTYLEIQGIKMIRADHLADDDLALLGFSCRAEYEQQNGKYGCMENGWLIWGSKIDDMASWVDGAAYQRTLLEITLHSPAIGHVRAHHLGAITAIPHTALETVVMA